MKKLPEINISYGDLYGMLIAPIQAKLLLTSIKFKVYNYLSEPKSADEVTEVIGTHPRNTRLFLDALVSMDLLKKENGLYRNLPRAQTFLVEGSPTYLGQLFTLISSSDISLENLFKLVKEGPPPLPETNPFSDESLAQGVPVLASSELAGDAQMVSEIVSKLSEFPSFRKMLDLGGGPGLIGMAIVDVHPSMKGVLFDLPPVIKIAKNYIKEYEMGDRMEVLSGDFNKDPIGEGYDLVLACNSLQFATDIGHVAEKVYNSLNLGGAFISIFPFALTHERTKPANTVLMMLPTALMGQDAGFDRGFIADSMLRAGFKSVHSRVLDTPFGQFDLDIARK
jgi:hypothetical protein